MNDKKIKKAVVLNGLSVLKLEELKKEFTLTYKRPISYDVIISKLLVKAKLEDVVN